MVVSSFLRSPDNPEDNPGGLSEAKARREALGDAADQLEEFIARPAADPAWIERVGDALGQVRGAFDAHVSEVEGDDGLLVQLSADAPRLAHGIAHLYDEHVEIGRMVEQTEALVRGGDEGNQPAIRDAAVELLTAISRHRHAGADLVFNAYNVDIGGE